MPSAGCRDLFVQEILDASLDPGAMIQPLDRAPVQLRPPPGYARWDPASPSSLRFAPSNDPGDAAPVQPVLSRSARTPRCDTGTGSTASVRPSDTRNPSACTSARTPPLLCPKF